MHFKACQFHAQLLMRHIRHKRENVNNLPHHKLNYNFVWPLLGAYPSSLRQLLSIPPQLLKYLQREFRTACISYTLPFSIITSPYCYGSSKDVIDLSSHGDLPACTRASIDYPYRCLVQFKPCLHPFRIKIANAPYSEFE